MHLDNNVSPFVELAVIGGTWPVAGVSALLMGGSIVSIPIEI